MHVPRGEGLAAATWPKGPSPAPLRLRPEPTLSTAACVFTQAQRPSPSHPAPRPASSIRPSRPPARLRSGRRLGTARWQLPHRACGCVASSLECLYHAVGSTNSASRARSAARDPAAQPLRHPRGQGHVPSMPWRRWWHSRRLACAGPRAVSSARPRLARRCYGGDTSMSRDSAAGRATSPTLLANLDGTSFFCRRGVPYGATCGCPACSTGLHGDHDVVTAAGRVGWLFSPGNR